MMKKILFCTLLISFSQAHAWDMMSALQGYWHATKEKVVTFCEQHPLALKVSAGVVSCCALVGLAARYAWKKYSYGTSMNQSSTLTQVSPKETTKSTYVSGDSSGPSSDSSDEEIEKMVASQIKLTTDQAALGSTNIKKIKLVQDTSKNMTYFNIKFRDNSVITYDMQNDISCIKEIYGNELPIQIDVTAQNAVMGDAHFFVTQYNRGNEIIVLLHEIQDNEVILKRIDLLGTSLKRIAYKNDASIEYKLKDNHYYSVCAQCPLIDTQKTLFPILFSIKNITKTIQQKAEECRYFYEKLQQDSWFSLLYPSNTSQEPYQACMNQDAFDTYFDKYNQEFSTYGPMITLLKNVPCCQQCKSELQGRCMKYCEELSTYTQNLESEITDKMSMCVASNAHELAYNFEEKVLANLKKLMSTYGNNCEGSDAFKPYKFLGISEQDWNNTMDSKTIGDICHQKRKLFPENSVEEKIYREIEVLSRYDGLAMWKAYTRWQKDKNLKVFDHLILRPNEQKFKNWDALWPENAAIKFHINTQLNTLKQLKL